MQERVAIFTQLSWFHVPRGTGTNGTLSGNEIPGFTIPCCWWDMTWQGWSPISGSAESLPSPPQGQGWCPAPLLPTPLCATSVKWHVNYTLQVETPCKLASRRGYLLAWNVSWAIFLPLLPFLPPLLLPDPYLGKQMKCQEEMSLQQVSLLWGISCTLIMVFVLWVVKFPSTSPVWS